MIQITEFDESKEIFLKYDEYIRINETLDKLRHNFIEIVISRPNKYKIKSSFWVGVIRLNDELTVFIKPKFSIDNLFKIIAFVDIKLINILNMLTRYEVGDDFLEILIRIFFNEVENLYLKKRWKI